MIPPKEHQHVFFQLLQYYLTIEKPLLSQTDLVDHYQRFCEQKGASICRTSFSKTIATTQEAALKAPWIYFAIRSHRLHWRYQRFHVGKQISEEIQSAEYLRFKEQLAPNVVDDTRISLEIDLSLFTPDFPKLKELRSIGHGARILIRALSSQLFDPNGCGEQELFKFLRIHQLQGKQLLLNQQMETVQDLREALENADAFLTVQKDRDAPWTSVQSHLNALGFEPGWGRTVRDIQENMALLSDTLEAPEPNNLEHFLDIIPMIFSVVILSPHGYFGQKNVLGLPDTGGQVIYILDQVRALEQEICRRILNQGLEGMIEPKVLIITRLIPEAGETTCNQPREAVENTHYTYILRIPFRDTNGAIIPHWISRFDIWPHLESFALETESIILQEIGESPGLIVGNYSDGNLVATLIARRLDVTQCTIAHALEKTKYPDSDFLWHEKNAHYHFASQFTADLFAMASSDFIITSTHQEIAGNDTTVGQYESYRTFTMPGLYRVLHGIDVYDPKFNVVSPGADPDFFFPFNQYEQRPNDLRETIQKLIFGPPGKTSRGALRHPQKPLLFTMARLDHIKNIAGLLDWYSANKQLREEVNLFIVGGKVDLETLKDKEERRQAERIHALMDRHALDGSVRWVDACSERRMIGEIYRCVADSRGAFVQPALFEAFGLTIIEAMTSGLPTFATCHGGPLEIIVNNVSGFHINPHHGASAADIIANFFMDCRQHGGDRWDQISKNAIQRIQSAYTWSLYADRMMRFARIYGYAKFRSGLQSEALKRYLEMFYALQYRALTDNVSC